MSYSLVWNIIIIFSEEELPEPPKKLKNTPKVVPLVKAPKQGKKDEKKLPETKRKASQSKIYIFILSF